MKNKNNWYWGLFFICAGGVLMVQQMGYFKTGISIWTLLMTVLLVPIIIKSLMNLNWGGILFPAAIILIMYKDLLGFGDLSVWAILLAALFTTIGLSLIFGQGKRREHCMHNSNTSREYDGYVNDENMEVGYDKDDDIDVKVSFGGKSRYINSENFTKAYLNVSFGALQVFFDNAKLSPEGAEIYLDANCAGVELYIPKEWNLDNNLNNTFAGIDEKNRGGYGDGPKVKLYGNVSFAGVEITYV